MEQKVVYKQQIAPYRHRMHPKIAITAVSQIIERFHLVASFSVEADNRAADIFNSAVFGHDVTIASQCDPVSINPDKAMQHVV